MEKPKLYLWCDWHTHDDGVGHSHSSNPKNYRSFHNEEDSHEGVRTIELEEPTWQRP